MSVPSFEATLDNFLDTFSRVRPRSLQKTPKNLQETPKRAQERRARTPREACQRPGCPSGGGTRAIPTHLSSRKRESWALQTKNLFRCGYEGCSHELACTCLVFCIPLPHAADVAKNPSQAKLQWCNAVLVSCATPSAQKLVSQSAVLMATRRMSA